MRLACSILLVVVVSSTASAQPSLNKTRAKEAYRLASQSYDLGEYRDALAKFKEAYRNYEEPSFLYNIAQCHRQLGERQEAIRFFRTYLIKKSDAPNRSEVEQMIARLEAEEREKTAAAKAAAQPPPSPAPVAEPSPQASKPVIVETPTVTATAPAKKTPVYKKWWVWTIVGVVVAGGAAGLAIGLTQSGTPSANTTFGTTSPF